MAIKTKTKSKPTIDISGPQGNAFFILGAAVDYGRQLGFDKDRIEGIRKEMMAGDYENLLEVFDRNFGEYVDLVR